MNKFKVGDSIYYDELELHNRIIKHRYHACVIQHIDKGNMLFGRWHGFSHIPTNEELKEKPQSKLLGWMFDNEVHLILPSNKNKRLN